MATPLLVKLAHEFGLIGSTGSPTGSMVPRGDTQDAQQGLSSDFADANRTGDPDIWSRYSSAMKRPVSFDSQLTMWDEMANWDLMTAALSEIVHEAIQTDALSPSTLWYECNDSTMEDNLNDMLRLIKAEDLLPSQVHYTASLGNEFEKIEYEPDRGVVGLSFAHPLDVRRYWLERNRRCIGFRWQGHKPRKDDAFVYLDNVTQIPRVAINTGNGTDNLFYPWDFMHIRRMFKQRLTEHGEPIFEEAQGIYKKLRLAIDQMVVHRAQVQPDRYVVNVDVKEQPPTEAMRTVNRWKQQLRSKLAFGPGQNLDTLNDPSGFNSFYNAMALDTILWMAKPTGFQHTVEKLAGTANVPDVYDIELLTDLFYSIIGMPKSWFGVTKGGESAPSGKSLVAQDIRFLRKIKSIRRPVINAYTWLGYFHALLRGQDVSKLEIKAVMSPIGSLEDAMKLELVNAQADVLEKLGGIMDSYKLPREAWVDVVFKRYLHMPDDIVQVFLTALPPETGLANESKLDAPSSVRLIKEIADKLRDHPAELDKLNELKNALKHGDEGPLNRKTPKMFNNINDVLEVPEFKDYDLIVSSFGENPFQFRAPEGPQASSTRYFNGPGYLKDSKEKSLQESTVKPTQFGTRLATIGKVSLNEFIPAESSRTVSSAPKPKSTSTQEAIRRYHR